MPAWMEPCPLNKKTVRGAAAATGTAGIGTGAGACSRASSQAHSASRLGCSNSSVGAVRKPQAASSRWRTSTDITELSPSSNRLDASSMRATGSFMASARVRASQSRRSPAGCVAPGAAAGASAGSAGSAGPVARRSKSVAAPCSRRWRTKRGQSAETRVATASAAPAAWRMPAMSAGRRIGAMPMASSTAASLSLIRPAISSRPRRSDRPASPWARRCAAMASRKALPAP